MVFDFSKLRGRIIEKYGSMAAFANEYGISKVVFSKKMTGNVRFTADDVVKMAGMLGIEAEEIGLYFFTLKV